jgi:hypothetical protein
MLVLIVDCLSAFPCSKSFRDLTERSMGDPGIVSPDRRPGKSDKNNTCEYTPHVQNNAIGIVTHHTKTTDAKAWTVSTELTLPKSLLFRSIGILSPCLRLTLHTDQYLRSLYTEILGLLLVCLSINHRISV